MGLAGDGLQTVMNMHGRPCKGDAGCTGPASRSPMDSGELCGPQQVGEVAHLSSGGHREAHGEEAGGKQKGRQQEREEGQCLSSLGCGFHSTVQRPAQQPGALANERKLPVSQKGCFQCKRKNVHDKRGV